MTTGCTILGIIITIIIIISIMNILIIILILIIVLLRGRSLVGSPPPAAQLSTHQSSGRGPVICALTICTARSTKQVMVLTVPRCLSFSVVICRKR